MKSKIAIAVLLTTVVSTAFSQGKTTIVTIQDDKVLGVRQVDNPPSENAFNTFEETDADADGRISPQEARNAGILAFASADLDNNGWLDRQEYEAAGSAKTELPAK